MSLDKSTITGSVSKMGVDVGDGAIVGNNVWVGFGAEMEVGLIVGVKVNLGVSEISAFSDAVMTGKTGGVSLKRHPEMKTKLMTTRNPSWK